MLTNPSAIKSRWRELTTSMPVVVSNLDTACSRSTAEFPQFEVRTKRSADHSVFASARGKSGHVARRLNMARRHLTQTQRRDMIAGQLKETPEQSDRQIAEALGVSHTTVAAVRKELEDGGQIGHQQTVTGKDGVKQPKAKKPKSKPTKSKVVDNSEAGKKGALEQAKDDPLAFVISHNLARRHLSESQRAMVAGKLANMRREDTLKQNRSANLRNDAVSSADAAAQLNVSTRSVESAKKVQFKAPDIAPLVEDGSLSVSLGAQVAYLPDEARAEIAEAPPQERKAKAKSFVEHNSGNNEWYTPPAFIEAAREVLSWGRTKTRVWSRPHPT